MRVVVLNADDFGYEPQVTAGIERSMRAGVVSSTTMMVNGPYSAEAAPRGAGLSIGLHLNLARWRSLSDGRTFDEAAAPTLSADFVEKETLAQLAELKRLI